MKQLQGGRTAHNMSSSSLRKKSDLTLLSKLRLGFGSAVLANLHEVILGTKLSVLFPAIPVAFLAYFYHFGNVRVTQNQPCYSTCTSIHMHETTSPMSFFL